MKTKKPKKSNNKTKKSNTLMNKFFKIIG
jgi:hypothetical protein